MLKIGPNGDGKSAVAILDGNILDQHFESSLPLVDDIVFILIVSLLSNHYPLVFLSFFLMFQSCLFVCTVGIFHFTSYN